ncbi:MAG: Holliday junction resolvase [Candidatus Aenigmarchaeota archaeon]|nr:Holliday junction resolvase [Candidatus Aenigmarchaeota archaeon]
MSRKSKGTNAERELIHLFWKTGRFAAVRVAGSGSIKYPVPDVYAASATKKLAIECKSLKGDAQYIKKSAVEELKIFAQLVGAQPVIAVRFDHTGWYFLPPEGLRDAGKNYVIHKEEVEFRAQTFEELSDTKTI